MIFTKNDYLAWRNHPVTVDLMSALTDDREEFANALIHGNALNDNTLYAQLTTKIAVIDDVLNYQPEIIDEKEGIHEKEN